MTSLFPTVLTQATIRRAELRDAPAIAAIHVRSWRATYAGLIAQEYLDSLSVEDRTASWVRRLSAQGTSVSTIIVAESPTGDMLGFAAGGPLSEATDEREAKLHALYVERSSHRHGLGRRLVATLAGHLVDRGFHSAVVAVLAGNPACAFYERLGATSREEIECEIGGRRYPERVYRWENLHTLAGATYRPGGPIVLADHDASWASMFADEASDIAAALGSALIALHHIGSTAIPGIVAKPVIDMLAVVRRIEALDESPHLLDPLGYEGLGEFGIAGRRYFRKTSVIGARTHQIHAFGSGSGEIQRHLDFRDYLRAHPIDARAYEALKRELADRCRGSINAYTDGKTHFIRDIERRAAQWRQGSPS